MDRAKVMPGAHSWTARCIVFKWVEGIFSGIAFESKQCTTAVRGIMTE